MRRLVDGCYLLAAGALAPLVVYRAARTGKYRTDWRERRGFLPELPPSDRRVWVHAVSVGEVNAARGVVDAWRKQDPTVEIVISTTTDTGLARARQIFPDLTVVRYPLDFSWFVARGLDRINPNLVVLIELEVWYQFVTLAADRGIPVAVINGRLSARSVRRFGLIRGLIRRMFGSLAWVGAQDGVYAERFRYMGVPANRVSVTGSVKWDGAEVADTIAGSDKLAGAMGLRPDRPIWVAGSTGPGEEAAILDAYKELRRRYPGLQLVLVPRKPERFDEVAELIGKSGFACVRRTQCPDGGRASWPSCDGGRASRPPFAVGDSTAVVTGRTAEEEKKAEAGGTPTPHTGETPAPRGDTGETPVPHEERKAGEPPVPHRPDGKLPVPHQAVVFLGDTMGELRKFYCMAAVVFVGRSLADMGGSDAMEVAALGKPVVVGPHNENFTDTIAQLQRGGAVEVLTDDLRDVRAATLQLTKAVDALLGDPAAARAMGLRGREVVLANRGATQRTLDVLMEMLSCPAQSCVNNS